MTDSLRRCLHGDNERLTCGGKLQVRFYDSENRSQILCGEKCCPIGETGPVSDYVSTHEFDPDALLLD